MTIYAKNMKDMVRAGSGFLDTGLIFHYNDGSKPGGMDPGNRMGTGRRQRIIQEETYGNSGGICSSSSGSDRAGDR